MADLSITEYTTAEEFARAWEGSDADIRMVWQLLGQLNADEKVGCVVIPRQA